MTLDTNLSLLQSIKRNDDSESWHLLIELYSPMIKRWLINCGVKVNDADDILQEVFVQVVKKIETFDRGQRPGSFRCWLKLVTLNCFRNYVRKRGNQGLASGGTNFHEFIQQCEDPESQFSHEWDLEHERAVIRILLKKVEPKFQPKTWQAFCNTTLLNRPAQEVAKELEMTVGSVHTAKSRVLAELRKLGKGLLSEDSEFPSFE